MAWKPRTQDVRGIRSQKGIREGRKSGENVSEEKLKVGLKSRTQRQDTPPRIALRLGKL